MAFADYIAQILGQNDIKNRVGAGFGMFDPIPRGDMGVQPPAPPNMLLATNDGSAPMPAPMPAPRPQMTTPAPALAAGNLPSGGTNPDLMPQQPAAQPGFLDKARSFLGSDKMQDLFLGLAMGSTPQQSMAMAAAQMAEGKKTRKTQEQQNQTVAWLQQNGIADPTMAKMIAGNSAALTEYIKSRTLPGSVDSVVVNNRLVNRRTGEVIADYSDQAMGAPVTRGLNAIYGEDANGNPVILQLGQDGKAVAADMPEGVTIRKDPIRIDAGTETILIDPVTRQPVGRVPKDIAGAAAEEVRGKAQGEAQVTLPAVLGASERMLNTIDSVLNDPNRERGTGMSSVFNMVPGTAGYDFAQKLDQLKGQVFLEAFESLKGGGAITEVEGLKAEQALARLSAAQSEGEFEKALRELRQYVLLGQQRARKKAGVTEPATTQPAQPGPVDFNTYFQ